MFVVCKYFGGGWVESDFVLVFRLIFGLFFVVVEEEY